MKDIKQSADSIFSNVKFFSTLFFLVCLLFYAFVLSPFEEKVKVAGGVVFMITSLAFLFVLYDSARMLVKRNKEKEEMVSTLESFINDEIFCSIDESSIRNISLSMVNLYMIGETLYTPNFPKNILTIICSYDNVYTIFRNTIVSNMENITLRLCSELAKGNKQDNSAVNAEVIKRRRIEDLLQELDTIDVVQNGLEYHLAKINPPKQSIVVTDYKDVNTTSPSNESTETIIL